MIDPIEYGFGGALIRSALPLPDLAPSRATDPKAPIIDVVSSDRPLEGERVFQWPEPVVFLERSPDGWVYRLPAQGLAIGVDTSGTTLRVESSADSRELAGEFLVRRVLPRVMDLHSRLLIHGATVAIAGRAGAESGAIALIGRSHAGKSTLAAALCRRGAFQLMGDDSVMLEHRETGWRAHASSRDGSLRPDSAAVFGDELEGQVPATSADKVRHRAPGAPVCETRALRALYVLDTGPFPRIEALSKYDAVRHAIQNVVRFNPGDWAAEAVRLARIHALVQSVPAARLAYPRVYDRLDDVCDVLMREHA